MHTWCHLRHPSGVLWSHLPAYLGPVLQDTLRHLAQHEGALGRDIEVDLSIMDLDLPTVAVVMGVPTISRIL
jgi:hypothetical protein